MKRKILVEASGSLTSGYLIKAIKEEGHFAVASDIRNDCFGKYLADDFIEMPRANDPELWVKISELLRSHNVDVVIPSLDETLLDWAQRRDIFLNEGIHVVVSDPGSVAMAVDKWLTYNFFLEIGVPTPRSSLSQDFPLVKPRNGRGAVGVQVTSLEIDMEGMISQEIIPGVEYTVDCFCDNFGNPIYIVPRRRLEVRDGKSMEGIVEPNDQIVAGVRLICSKVRFRGPVNIQCFVGDDGEVTFIEINPRIAGGMALGFAATENWIGLIERSLLRNEPIEPLPINYGMQMKRYYAEVFIPAY